MLRVPRLVEYFRGHPLVEHEPVGLRVSRYLTQDRHVRLSIWNNEQALAVIALEEREARRLAAFLARRFNPATRAPLLDRVRAQAEQLVGRRLG